MSDITTKITTLLKLFSSLFKGKSVSEKQIPPISNSAKAVIDLETSTERPKEEEQEPHLEGSLEERPKIVEKNKWLYPTDGFGKMEHGVVDNESKDAHKKERRKRRK